VEDWNNGKNKTIAGRFRQFMRHQHSIIPIFQTAVEKPWALHLEP
jgi:hypothetical protein